MSRLGCVLAGGRSSRFGSDKALARLGDATLLDRAVAALAAWCDEVVVVGRDQAPAPVLPDWPGPGMGPLGGIAAALRHARASGHAEVLTCGVDSLGLPADLPALLSPAPACLEGQPVIGLWPAGAAEAVEAILAASGRHSLRALAEATGARMVRTTSEPDNINTPDDLARARLRHGA
jgi:molybdenum cofactor guanylyltransferase